MNTTNSFIKFIKGFGYALNGIKKAVWSERNLRFHSGMAVIVFCMGLIAELSCTEYILLFLISALVISLEMINSAIERAVDLGADGEKTPLAGEAKDIAAGAVLVSAFFAVLSGIMLFGTKGRLKTVIIFFKENLWADIVGIIFVTMWLIWVFRCDFSRLNKIDKE